MRTATLTFDHGKLLVRTGIRIVTPLVQNTIQLFAHPERLLDLSYLDVRRPLIVTSEGGDLPGEPFLALLSLITDPDGTTLLAVEEQDSRDQVLLFIDTCDGHARGQKGRYLVPPDHDGRLPFARSKACPKGADFGLAICSVGASLVVQSTGGAMVNLRLGSEGKFSVQPCSEQERILMGSDT